MVMWVVLSTLWLVDGHKTSRRRSFVLAGLFGGLAAATKYNAGVVMFPVLVSQAIQMVDARRAGTRPRFDGRMLWFGVPSALIFLSGTYFILTNFDGFKEGIDVLIGSMQTGNAAGDADLSNGWLHHARYSLRYGVGMPAVIAALAGACFAFRREWRLTLVLVTFPIVYFAVAGSVRNIFFRYALPLVPFLCVLASHAIITAARWLTRQSPQRMAAVATALTALAAAPSVYRAVSYDRIAAQTDSRVLLVHWFLTYARAGETIAQSGSHYGHGQIPREHLRPWAWDRRQRAFVEPWNHWNRAEGLPDYIVVQDSPLPSATQPIIEAYLRLGYTLAHRIDAFTPDPGRVYDMQDAFFIPFDGFRGVDRPGPNFLIYRKNPR